MTTLMPWWAFAVLSAVFAGATTILAKIGIAGVPSNLGTAIRTVFILAFAWTIAVANGEQRVLSQLSPRTWVFLALSALTTGLSWLAYFRALQLGPASRVASIDKLSVVIAVLLAWLVLREPLSWRLGLGVTLIVGGVFLCVK